MSMNRETKRMLQRQGQLGEDGTPAAKRRPAPTQKPKEQRTKPGEFVKEVRGEMRKVAWPTRAEVINYSIIVFVALILLTAFIAALDFAFGEAVLQLFDS